jgi:hypothetical protein
MMLKKPLLFALPMGLLTWVLIGTLKSYLPPSQTTGAVFDALAFPGALAASLVYPEGVHTGHGAPRWALLVVISNMILYSLFWYMCLKITGYFRRRPARA